MNVSKRVKSFVWRAGLFALMAISAYTMNLGDIREIDFWKLGTILLVTLSTFVGNEITKYFNS